MPAVDRVLPLVTGEKLSREEFLRRWEALPQLKNAELIGGIVYVSSPVSLPQRSFHSLVHHWLAHYAAFTPGCDAGIEGTWLMRADAPQPDVDLRILPEYGGQSRVEGAYPVGAPELIAEITVASTSHDLGPKLELYRQAGVREYITVLVEESQVTWRRLVAGAYNVLEPDAEGILRSALFTGLWLDPQALLRQQVVGLMAALDRGLQSPEHEEFVRALAARKRG